ncbi:ATP-dependent DNA ligase LigA [Halalkalicoccus salilacus]|uniref:ATP-dependent DNA ligase LigA n=1 Tax=Halalkalicoccus salilacus TaxID=3117459 RepID=UPI00300ECD48
MEFEEFAARAAEIEAETADLEIERLVAALLADANDDLAVLARFVQGRVFPAWDSRTLDIGPQLCYEAIARAAGTNVTAADVEERLAERGEIGEVAASYEFGGQQGLAAFGEGTDALTVSEVDEELRTLAAASGSGSQERKLDALFGLFNRCSPEEARYLSRLVLSEMRIGVGSGTVRDAIGDAFDVPPEAVERALQVSNDYGLVAEIAREAGESGLSELSLEIGRPVQAMLAQTGTVVDAIEDWREVAAEWKFDGARVQIHYTREEDGVSIYSRNMEEVTDALPEVVAFVEEHLDESAILDGEVVAVDDDGAPLPFQEVLRRFRRKHDVERAREETELRLYAFDCLHAAGEDLLDAPLEERYERLSALLSAGVSERWLTDDPDEIAGIEGEALEAGHEGLMLKNPDSTYSPGRRGRNWRKRKPDVETLDLVVTGAEWGEGRRATFLGSFLLSVATESGFETIGKVATGITDEKLAELTELLDPHVLAEEGRNVEIRPEVVFEVGYEEIQRSPTYESGYALRFPRFLGVRDDKDPEDADSLSRVRDLYGGEG